MNWREVKTLDDMFEWSALPPNIPRMTFCRADAIGYPAEVVEHLGFDEIEDIRTRDTYIILATMTRLCTLEDKIERGELRRESRAPWINVKDRLPETTGRYLVSIHCPKGDWIEVDRYDNGDWVWDSGDYHECSTEFVTHWMQLPEPPEPAI